ncbi:MAG: glycosyltransferase family 2 protein [Anaerolineaceae bacterium]|jgi:hypothetical protein|nr:MAG: glycosyltransferase family 2 protein [Anaerolineaceae bacterium]
MSQQRLLPIDPLFDPPPGWLAASLPEYTAVTRSIMQLAGAAEDPASFDKAREQILRERWLALTSVEPNETRFSIIVPVHNEEIALPSFLGALLASEVPADADAAVIFIVNGSSDGSAQVIRNRLARIRPVMDTILPRSRVDLQRSATANQFGLTESLRFLVVETPVPGKANALNIGNEIARAFGHEMAMNIDANNWVEPDSLARLYSCAHRHINRGAYPNTVIVNAGEFYADRRSTAPVTASPRVQKAEVTGWMFAWSTQWIHDCGGFPQGVIEDYGAGLLALSQGRQIAESGARIWGYAAANPFEESQQMVRFLYGAMQLSRHFSSDPNAMKILLEDFPNLRPLMGRFEHHFLRKFKAGRPITLARGLIRWLRNEILALRARQKLYRDPNGQTWEPVYSTKFGLSAAERLPTESFVARMGYALAGKILIYFDNLFDFLDRF